MAGSKPSPFLIRPVLAEVAKALNGSDPIYNTQQIGKVGYIGYVQINIYDKMARDEKSTYAEKSSCLLVSEELAKEDAAEVDNINWFLKSKFAGEVRNLSHENNALSHENTELKERNKNLENSLYALTFGSDDIDACSDAFGAFNMMDAGGSSVVFAPPIIVSHQCFTHPEHFQPLV